MEKFPFDSPVEDRKLFSLYLVFNSFSARSVDDLSGGAVESSSAAFAD